MWNVTIWTAAVHTHTYPASPSYCLYVLPQHPRPRSRENSRHETWNGLDDASLSRKTWGGRSGHSTWRKTGLVYWSLHVLRQRHRNKPKGKKQRQGVVLFAVKLIRTQSLRGLLRVFAAENLRIGLNGHLWNDRAQKLDIMVRGLLIFF